VEPCYKQQTHVLFEIVPSRVVPIIRMKKSTDETFELRSIVSHVRGRIEWSRHGKILRVVSGSMERDGSKMENMSFFCGNMLRSLDTMFGLCWTIFRLMNQSRKFLAGATDLVSGSSLPAKERNYLKNRRHVVGSQDERCSMKKQVTCLARW